VSKGARLRRRARREKTEGPLRKITEWGYFNGSERLECGHWHQGFPQVNWHPGKVAPKFRRCLQCRSLWTKLTVWLGTLVKTIVEVSDG
jgi:hypothetical protein